MSRLLSRLRIFKIALIFFSIVLLLLGLYFEFPSRLQLFKVNKIPKCVNGEFQGIRTDAGLGNVMFELMSFIGISHTVQRVPIFLNEQHRRRIQALKGNFPFLVQYLLAPNVTKSKCASPVIRKVGREKCCTYDEGTVDMLKNSEEQSLTIFSYYLQSHRYLTNLSKGLVQQLVTPTNHVTHLAKTSLVPEQFLAGNNSRICIHMRLGDFLQSPLSLPTSPNFTTAAVKHVLRLKEQLNPLIFAFSNDPNVTTAFFREFDNFHHISYHEKRPANVEWEFSRLYCDVVILTASSSTYGWWMGYLSKGQEVYYSKDYSRPGGLEKEVAPQDFWMPHWVPLRYLEKTGIVFEENW